jgi:hypothetical protein
MGANDTAAFDPIFFFHHCFVDRLDFGLSGGSSLMPFQARITS